jgi:hypothetical protein
MLHDVLSNIFMKSCCTRGYNSKIKLQGEVTAMPDKKGLCDKIQQLYPDIGECGIDLTVDYDKRQNAWVVDLKKDNHE